MLWPSICAGLVLLTGFVYAELRSAGFIELDDPSYVTRNARVLRGLSGSGVAWAWSTFRTGNWHPLTWLSLMLDVQLFGLNPAAIHLVNLALHLANACLVFLIFARWTDAPGKSAFVAALFAVHPLHVESVAWISERKDVLSTLFLLGALWFYGEYVRGGSRIAYALSIASMALGLLAKPMLVTLPFVLLLLDIWPHSRLSMARPLDWVKIRWLCVEKLPFLGLAIASSAITLRAQAEAGAIRSLVAVSLPARLENAVISYVRYLHRTVWPTDLSVFYPLPPDWPTGLVGLCLLLLVAITIGVWMARSRAPYLLTGWVYYLGTLVPVVGIVQVGGQAIADRYTYVPLLGVFWMVAWAGSAVAGRHPQGGRILAVLAVATVFGASVVAHRYVAQWRDGEALFTHALASDPHCFVAQGFLGRELIDVDLERASHHLQRSIEIEPRYPDAHFSLGKVRARQGRLEAAAREFEVALTLRPDDWESHFELARLHERRGDLAGAAASYRLGLELYPGAVRAGNALGIVLAKQGRVDEAIATFQGIILRAPEDGEAYQNLGIAYELIGDTRRAVERYRAATRFGAWSRYPLRRLAWILSTSPDASLRDSSSAVHFGERACRATGFRDPEALDALAAAYAESGAFGRALETAARARDLAAGTGRAELARTIEGRMVLYRRGEAFRDQRKDDSGSPATRE